MPDAPVLPPVTAETVREHMRAEHCPSKHGADECGLTAAELPEVHEYDHDPARRIGPAFGHTHSPPAADEGTTT